MLAKLIFLWCCMTLAVCVQDEQSSCSATTWLVVSNKTATGCRCGKNIHRVVRCRDNAKEHTVEVLKCHAMTFSEEYNKTVVGDSLMHCVITRREFVEYVAVPNNPSDLNTFTCSKFNRVGLQCGKCAPNHSITVYSYGFNCTQCKDYSLNWVKYLTAVTLPTTLMYLFFLFFRFRATDPIIHELVVYSQLIMSPLSSYVVDANVARDHMKKSKLLRVFTYTLLGIWNLDFGRFIYSPICLHPHMSTYQALALDYVGAFYPLLLVLVSFILVRLYSKYRVVAVLARPILRLFRLIKEWDSNVSLIDVFATFILLSNAKLLNVSFSLISFPVSLYDSHGKILPVKYTTYNGSMEYIGHDHWPYFMIGILVILFCCIIPLLLLSLYSCLWFQRCLSYFSLNRAPLHIFMNAFQECYKKDYRYFSSVPFLLRGCSNLLQFVTISHFYYSRFAIILTGISSAIALTRPFKSDSQNIYNIVMYLALGCQFFFANVSIIGVYSTALTWYLFERVSALIFYVPILGIVLYYARKFLLVLGRMIRRKNNRRNSVEHDDSGRKDSYGEFSALLHRTI